MEKQPSVRQTPPSLLLRIRNSGDQQAWQTFVDTYGPLIYNHCRQRGLQDADAADVMQLVLTQVSGSIKTFDYQPERGRFRDWLGTVTRHEIGRFAKKRERSAQPVGGDAQEAVLAGIESRGEDSAWTEEFNAHVYRTALDRVQPLFEEEVWKAFVAVWTNERPPEEVAQELGRRPDWVYKVKSRVLKRLEQEVKMLAEESIG